MLFPTESPILNIALILAGVVITWGLIKAIFKITLRIFAAGCGVLVMLIVLGIILGLIG